MAPIGEAYFPPLDKCFSGEQQLLSWETCYVALSQLDVEEDSGSFRRHFSDPQTTDLLLRALSPYPDPSPQTKASFETKTSTINVTPSPHARYKIKEIQDDTLWLSREASIDEVSALRIAILEWQTASAAQLLKGSIADDAALASGMNGGVARLQASSFGLQQSILGRSARIERTPPTLDRSTVRRRRSLEILLSERQYILKVAEYLLSSVLQTRGDGDVNATAARRGKKSGWVADLGSTLLSSWLADESPNGKAKSKNNDFLTTATRAIRSRLEALGRGSGWSASEDVQEHIELAWATSQTIEMVHIEQIMVNLLQASSTLVKPEIALPWFRLMSDCGFLEAIQLPYPSLQTLYLIPLQSLATLVSLAVLNVSSALEVLIRSSTAALSVSGSTNTTSYLLNQPAVNEINDILISAAPLRTSSPAVLAWSIITQHMREVAIATRDSRELRQSIRAADKFGAADSSDTDGADRSSSRSPSALRRRSSTGSDTSQQATLLEEINDSLAITAVDGDPIAYLANNAVSDGKVFDVVTAVAVEYCTPYGFELNGVPGQRMRKGLIDLIRACVDFVDYQPALVMATMAILTGSERYWETLDRSPEPHTVEPATMLLAHPILKSRIWLMALSRFPYESLPLLQLCRALAFQNDSGDGPVSPIWIKLQELDTFTCLVPLDFEGYAGVREEEENHFLKLIENLTFAMGASSKTLLLQSSGYSKLSRMPTSSAVTFGTIEIPQGTEGQVLSNSKPLVVAWNHEFSGLTYMGKVLQYASIAGLSADILAPSSASSDTVGEIINLVTAMLSSAVKSPSTKGDSAAAFESASSILGHASDGLDRNQDIISVVFRIFENELYKARGPTEDGESIDLLVQCIQFTHALLPIMPDRVWPFLGRSGLLGIGHDGNQLGVIVSCQEMIVGQYDFLLGCIRVFDALIEDAVTNVVSRKTPTRAIARFGSANTLGAGISQPAMENVLLCFQRIMIDVFESIVNWKFVRQADRSEINARLCSTFDKLLNYCYDVNDASDISQKLTSPLAPAAQYALDVFLSNSNSDLTVKPLLQIFAEGVTTPTTSLPTAGMRFQTARTTAALRLATTLVRVNQLREQPPSRLETHLFEAATTLARVYVSHESYKLPVIDLFDALVRSAPTGEGQPPSLLGHLGTVNANCFLEVLSTLSQPLNNGTLSIAIWKLLSAVVSNRQQWLAIYILTGNTPRESLKDKETSPDSTSGRSEPILNIALDSLCNVNKLEPQQALGMLEFISLSADFWPWVLTIVEQHPRFLRSISEYAAHIGNMAGSTHHKSCQVSSDYNSLQMTSYIADILAMYTNHTHRSNNSKFAKMIVPHLNHLIKNAIVAPSYNASLHGNLRQNFSKIFPSCTLADFKRTGLKTTQLGDSYFYDLEMANKMLAYEPAWIGRKGQGFADEVKRANLNLSTVEAQINLFHSWKTLLIELSGLLATDPKFQKIMAVAVTDCLRANAENTLPEAIFERLSESRSELAFTLLQKLIEVKSSEPEVKSVLPVTWNTLRAHNVDLEAALGSADAKYHRMLLKILFTSLQPHVSSQSPSQNSGDSNATHYNGEQAEPWSETSGSIIQTALEIISTTIAHGFRSLTILLHSNPHLVHPSDLALLTAILRSCLRIPDLTRNSTHLLDAFSSTQTARYASTLLSWSTHLAASTNGDPVYGDLSILFLLELSTVSALAESLAVEGVLSHVLSTNLIDLLQSRPFGPFDQSVRMYAIWSRGILPLLLNLLHAVGPPIAAEVAAALNTFPQQLARASNAFSANSGSSTTTESTQGYITLGMASEAQSLALIVSILRTFHEAGASAAVRVSEVEEVKWDSAQVKEDVEAWLQRRGELREKIVATSGREEEMSRTKPSREGAGDNLLEERVAAELRGVVGVLGGGE